MKHEPAFPCVDEKQVKNAFGNTVWQPFGHNGLTKREWFAGLAMQGFVLHYSEYVDCNFETKPHETAARAVAYADALLRELEETKDFP